MARYLVVKVETDEAFTAIRRALHDYSISTGEYLADMGTNIMDIADRLAVQEAFESTVRKVRLFNEEQD